MNYKQEDIEIKGSPVRFITIQTNEQNSFTKENLLEFEALVENCKNDQNVKALVITSENEKFFSNGVDAQNIINTPAERLADEMGQIVKFFNYLITFDKPLISEISGYAMGGGGVVALACDYRYMLEGKARLSFTEVFFGLPLPGTFIEKIKLTVKPEYINDFIYGSAFKAHEAKAAGFIHETASDRASLRNLVNKKLDQLLRIPSSAFRHTKQTLNHDIRASTERHMKSLAENFANPVIMSNLLEAMKSLQENRRPRFQ